MKKILITGASGYIGSHLGVHLKRKNYQVKLVGRSRVNKIGYEQVTNLYDRQTWEKLLYDIDTVVHLAASAHINKKLDVNYFRRTNFALDKVLISAVKNSSVKQFINMSSIGVNGESNNCVPFSAIDKPRPIKPYAIVKSESEALITSSLLQANIDCVHIRPPMVYGAGAPGNFARLQKLACASFPNIFTKVINLRHFIAIDNLSDFVEICLRNPLAANQTFTVSDPTAVSTAQVYASLQNHCGVRSTTLGLQPSLLRAGLRLYGGNELLQSLTGNLTIDNSKATRLLNWRAPVDNITQYKFPKTQEKL